MRQQGIRVATRKEAKHRTDTDYNVVAMTGILDDNYSNKGDTMRVLKPLPEREAWGVRDEYPRKEVSRP